MDNYFSAAEVAKRREAMIWRWAKAVIQAEKDAGFFTTDWPVTVDMERSLLSAMTAAVALFYDVPKGPSEAALVKFISEHLNKDESFSVTLNHVGLRDSVERH